MERHLVPVLRGVMLLSAAAFLGTQFDGLNQRLPYVVNALVANGVYVTAALLVLLRAWLVPARRGAWLCIGLGLCAYAGGAAYSWAYAWRGAVLPFPSLADVAWLSFYPFAYVGILIFLREQAPARRTLLDGAITGLGGAAVFSALVVDRLVATAGTGDLGQYVALAYPLGDCLLLGTVLARMAVSRWAGGPSLLVLAGFGAFIAADTGYVTRVATGDYLPGSVVDVLYLAGLVMIALAAWRPSRPGAPPSESSRLGVSVWFAVAALAVLLVGTRQPMSNLTVTLAGLTLLSVVLRVQVSFQELESAGRARHDEARRDPLTGLANRRAVLEHLDRALARPRPLPLALLLLDLDRFKEVNDTHGHQAGDRLLEQAAARLAAVTRSGDLLARLGGDEFVLVLSGDGVTEQGAVVLAGRIRESLSGPFAIEGAGDVRIDVSTGIALRDGGDAHLLFQQADIAMYHAKRAGGGHAVFGRLDGQSREPAGARL